MNVFSLLFIATMLVCVASSSDAQTDERPLTKGKSVRSNAESRQIDVASEIRQHQIRQHKPVKDYVARELSRPKPFSEGVVYADDLPKMPVPVRQWDLTDPWSAWCEAAWDQTCSGDEQWVPPDGWEICRFNLVVDSISKGEWRINSVEKRRFSVHLHSWGSRFPLDRWGGSVRVRLATVNLVAAGSPEADRTALGCSFTNGAGPAGSPGTEETFCLKPPGQPGVGTQMCMDFIYEAGQKKYIRGPYPCGVCVSN